MEIPTGGFNTQEKVGSIFFPLFDEFYTSQTMFIVPKLGPMQVPN